MLKWLGLSRRARPVEADRFPAQPGRGDDQLSLFLIISFWLQEGEQTDEILRGRSNLIAAGLANGWAAQLADGPARFALIDGSTIDRFVGLRVGKSRRRLAEARINEVRVYDLHYRSVLEVTGTSFGIALHPEAAKPLLDYLDANQVDGFTGLGGAFAMRLPIRRPITFPEPRGSDEPYSGRPAGIDPLRSIAKFTADWIEVAAMDRDKASSDMAGSVPLRDLFASDALVRISLGR